MRKCRKCGGRGEVPAGGKFGGYKTCPYCGGTGDDVKMEEMDYGGVNSGRGPSKDWNDWDAG